MTTASKVIVGDQIVVVTNTSYINHACGVTQSPRMASEASEFATVSHIERNRGGVKFTFSDGRIMFTHANSKVGTVSDIYNL